MQKMLNKYFLLMYREGLIQGRYILRIKVQKRQVSCQNQGNEESHLAGKIIPQGNSELGCWGEKLDAEGPRGQVETLGCYSGGINESLDRWEVSAQGTGWVPWE